MKGKNVAAREEPIYKTAFGVSSSSSTSIYNAQLSRMSHCAPVARKPICLEFTPEAAVGNILVA